MSETILTKDVKVHCGVAAVAFSLFFGAYLLSGIPVVHAAWIAWAMAAMIFVAWEAAQAQGRAKLEGKKGVRAVIAEINGKECYVPAGLVTAIALVISVLWSILR